MTIRRFWPDNCLETVMQPAREGGLRVRDDCCVRCAARGSNPRPSIQQAVNKTDDGKGPPGYTAADFSTSTRRRSERLAAGQ
jgi:hypothetical protein